MADDRWKNVLTSLWQEQSRWSRRADEQKRSYRSWTGPLIAAGFVGVVLSTLSPELVAMLKSDKAGAAATDRNFWQMAAALAGPLIVAVAAALTRELRSGTTDQQWAKARGIAEALKAQGYLFASGAPPYSDEQTAPQQLATAMNEMTSTAANELGPLPPAAQGLEQKHPHDVIDEQAYITRRVQPQADFHERGALDNRNKLQRWRTVGLLLAVVAAALGVIAGVQKNASINVWVAVVSTAIATLTSFIYAGRFEFFAATYFATATKLRGRLRIWQAAADKSR